MLEQISEKAKQMDLLVIADAKRGDIGSTAKAYAEAFLGKKSSIRCSDGESLSWTRRYSPFCRNSRTERKGNFVLVKTSNTSAGEFQDLPVGDCLLHEEVARSVARIGSTSLGECGFSSVGAVVGQRIRMIFIHFCSEMPSQIFLVPGYGAQGGSAADVASALYFNGQGAIINSSRGILFASSGIDFAEAAAKSAEKSTTRTFHYCVEVIRIRYRTYS